MGLSAVLNKHKQVNRVIFVVYQNEPDSILPREEGAVSALLEKKMSVFLLLKCVSLKKIIAPLLEVTYIVTLFQQK